MKTRDILNCCLYSGSTEQMTTMPKNRDIQEYAGGVICEGEYDPDKEYLLVYTIANDAWEYLRDGRDVFTPDVVCTHDDNYILLYAIED